MVVQVLNTAAALWAWAASEEAGRWTGALKRLAAICTTSSSGEAANLVPNPLIAADQRR